MKKFTKKDIKKTHAGISRIKAMLKMALVSIEKMIDFTIDEYDLNDINEVLTCIKNAIKFLDSLNSNLNEGNLCYDAKEIKEYIHKTLLKGLHGQFEDKSLVEYDDSNSDSICDFIPQDGCSSNE